MKEMTLFHQQIAEVKITYSHKVKPSNLPKIDSSRTAYNLIFPLWSDMEYQESFAVLLLNRNNKVLGVSFVSMGGTASCVVDTKMIYQTAIKANAAAIILAHNHPSGNLTPSQADMNITRKLKEAGQVLDISVLDHIILTSENYHSMADDGEM